jgi:protein gp37
MVRRKQLILNILRILKPKNEPMKKLKQNIPTTEPTATVQAEAKVTAVASHATTLTESEKTALAGCEATIRSSVADAAGGFQKLSIACFVVQRDELYREFASEAAYFKSKFGFSRSHSLRLAQMGRLLHRRSPAGDTSTILTSDAHVRPLLKLGETQQDAVIAKAQSWATMAKLKNVPAKLVAAAVALLNPPNKLKALKESAQSRMAAKFQSAVDAARSKLPVTVDGAVVDAFKSLSEVVKSFSDDARRSTGISWTEKTWNPLHGCTRASEGCVNCYAAKLMATRLADVYPGLAVEKTSSSGVKTYAFTGKIALAPGLLADPLNDQIPKMIFVNSMSDLFHKDVPEEFIEAIFDVMERAHWHTFQVLTKRPERMADFTMKRYADRSAPKNVWLGTSTENQETFDERLPHLKRTKAAVRWLSAEPLIGAIKLADMDGIHWVVVGGESGAAARLMKKAWATEIRDACKQLGIAFFFKQWGMFNEAGVREREKTKPAKLDGIAHEAYPTVEN